MKKIDSLNLIPFIDIVLVLLVIVLTTASFIKQDSINVDIPKIDSKKDSSDSLNKDEIIISIKKDGKLYFNDNEVSLNELRFQISRIKKDSSIVINGDKNSNFDSFVKIMSMLQELGYENVFILIDKDKS
ncbi:biopolymer transporter ExbD [Helicobacter sp. MIT 14-3879]|uniref:biopolymer transporter ExbD n=1 Tax=Helicobacter sp. MIT 14-3879 TaxID=2040649 RepID=UPI000E1EE534|nr:biopolymer transporter ExbD [Helicobacter sp. MIT 14-3879]RDU64823.1 biopolymer transporter ExbD [Helicobacter sp. MIT 14-3879]